jgi:hypothetical protein
MIQRALLEDFVNAGHEKNETEYEPREQDGPGNIGICKYAIHNDSFGPHANYEYHKRQAFSCLEETFWLRQLELTAAVDHH